LLAAAKIEGLVELIELVGIVIEDVRIFVGFVVALNVMLGVVKALDIKFEKLDGALDDCEGVDVGVGVD
jgi:hypothetical protein